MNDRLPKVFAAAFLVLFLLGIPAGVSAQTSQNAGKISAVLPIAYVHRGPQQLSAAPALPVDWGDVVNTGHLARVRVALNDGSILNVGSDSNMTVVQHDAGAQQTDLELNYGRVRARAVKLVKPNANFQIRTPTGVAGVVGTDFEISYENDTTHVIVFEGKVRFCALIPEKKKEENAQAGPGEATPPPATNPGQEQEKEKKRRGLVLGPCVIVGAGAASSVRFNEAPSQPAPVTPMNLTQAMNSTSVSSAGGAAGGGAGAAAGGAGAAGGGIGAAGGIIAGVGAAVAATVATVVVRSVSKTTTCSPPPPAAGAAGRCAILQKGGARPINGQRPH